QQLLHRLTNLFARPKCPHFNFRLRPSRHFSHFLDRRVFTVNHQQRLLIFRRQNRQQAIGEISRHQIILDRRLITIARLLVQPTGFILSEIRNGRLRSPFRASHHIQTSVRRDSRQPSFERSTTFKLSKLRVSFQKNFLRCFFNQTSLPEEPARHAEHARAVTSHYLCKGRLVAYLRLTRQVEIQGLFEPTRQL